MNVGPQIVTVIAAVIGLAIVAVLVSQKAQTSTVLTGAGTALSGIISAAVAPVSGGGSSFGGNAQGAGGTAG